jgi:hypothetical protein
MRQELELQVVGDLSRSILGHVAGIPELQKEMTATKALIQGERADSCRRMFVD